METKRPGMDETLSVDEKVSAKIEERDKSDGFNAKHPELQEGERFHMNIFRNRQELAGKIIDPKEEFNNIGFQSKRLGEQAYAVDGQVDPEGRPVFISGQEYRDYLTKLANEGHLS